MRPALPKPASGASKANVQHSTLKFAFSESCSELSGRVQSSASAQFKSRAKTGISLSSRTPISMILNLLESLLRGLHNSHTLLIQITKDQSSFPIQEPSSLFSNTRVRRTFSNNSSFANVPTPPSIHHHVHVC
jgi:hypothetical protein